MAKKKAPKPEEAAPPPDTIEVEITQAHIDTGGKRFIDNPVVLALHEKGYKLISAGPDILYITGVSYLGSMETAENLGRYLNGLGMKPYLAKYKRCNETDLIKRQRKRNPGESLYYDRPPKNGAGNGICFGDEWE